MTAVLGRERAGLAPLRPWRTDLTALADRPHQLLERARLLVGAAA